MLEILCKVLFFLSMLVLYVNVTSTSIVIVIVLGYIVCIFSYYYFDNVRSAIDECFNYCNLNATKFSDSMNPSQVSGYFNRKYKMSNNGIGSLGGKPKLALFSNSLYNPDGGFSKENNLFDSCGTSSMKADYRNGELPSPILKNSNSSTRNAKLSRDKMKITFSPKEIARKSGQVFNAMSSSRRYNANLDLETYMNVNSPGFTSRVVDKAVESASYHLKYPAVRQVSSYRFDKSTLRQLSKIPKVNSTMAAAAVRIAPPEVCSMNLLPNESAINDDGKDDGKNNNILQVLKDMSRKRNYSQEETDRSGSTPKKSRKNEIRNTTASATVSQHKRAHEDCSNDNFGDKNRKKRCDDADRDIVKMMSYTSGLSIQGFSWDSQPKKRKSSKLEKSKNESPEKFEKFRKISDEHAEEKAILSPPQELPVIEDQMMTTQSPVHEPENRPQVPAARLDKDSDGVDCEKEFVSFIDEDEDYVRVAGGKILNRTNCTYRKKLNTKKIDPISVISTEPEYVNDRTNYMDDKVMKETLLHNFMNDMENKEDQHENVIFYPTSILEDMANKVVVEVEVHQQETKDRSPSPIAKPLQAPPFTPAFHFKDTSGTKSTEKHSNDHSTPILTNGLSNSNPLLKEQPAGFTFGCKPVIETDSPKMNNRSSDLTQNLNSTPKIENVPVAVSVSFTLPMTTNSIKTEITTPTTNSNLFTGMVKPSSEVSKSLSESITPISSVTSSSSPKINFSNPATSQSNNPLLAKPAVSLTNGFTAGVPTFGNSTPTFNAQNTTEQTAATPKISMFGNTVIKPVTGSPPSFSVNNLTPTQNNAVTASSSPFSTSIQSSSTLVNSSFTVNQPTSISTASTGSPSTTGFKFGASSHSTATTSTSSAFNVSSAPTAVSTFGATAVPSFGNTFTSPTTSSSFPATTEKPPLFPSAINSSGTPSFNFGASNSGGMFGTNISQPVSTFNSSPSQSSVFGSGQLTTTTSSQSSIFSAPNNQSAVSFNPTPGVGQSASATPIFGNNTASNSLQNTQPPTLFGASVFGQSSQTNGPTVFGGGSAAAPTGGSGDGGNSTGNLFKSQSSVTSSVQTPQFGNNSGGFVFGTTTNNQPPSATFGSVASPFDSNVNGAQSAFGTNTSSSTLNFQSPATNFGSNSNAIGGSSFAAPATAQPATNSVFNFGSNGSAGSVPAQPTFQFGPSVPSQPTQSFVFGGGNSAPAPATNAGGFSIGSGGGGGGTTRNRVMARPRKTK